MKPFRILVSAVSLILCGLWVSCSILSPIFDPPTLVKRWVFDHIDDSTNTWVYTAEAGNRNVGYYFGIEFSGTNNNEFIVYEQTWYASIPNGIVYYNPDSIGTKVYRGGKWRYISDKLVQIDEPSPKTTGMMAYLRYKAQILTLTRDTLVFKKIY
jgi:hypothetical protein